MRKYSLGLDIGTNSVGWAVVDENSQLVKKNGFTLWGVRMFEEANTAAERRGYRSSRRRLARRRQRILLLQNEFNAEISKIDKNFFQRLNDSFYKKEDKMLQNKYTFFDDEYTDKKYFEMFPTIYHLRNHLLNTDDKMDIRMVYLAIHHIIKYRGNFLNENEMFNKSDTSNFKNIFTNVNLALDELKNIYEDDDEYFENISNVEKEDFYSNLEEIINGKYVKKEKEKKLIALFGVEKKTLVTELYIPLLVGRDVKIEKLSLLEEQHLEMDKINLSSAELEELIDKAIASVPDLQLAFQQILSLKIITDTIYLKKILDNGDTLSESMVKVYDSHKNQLDILKKLIKTYLPQKNNECFKKLDDKLNNYPKYIGMNSTNGKIVRVGHCSPTEFYKYIKSLLKEITDDSAKEQINEITSLIDNNNYLLRQNSGSNGVLPMQLNLQELKIILEKQSKYYPFLNEKIDDLSRIDRIIKIFKYKLPYYVGPLNSVSERSWFTKKEEYKNTKIFPWNYEKVIDLDQTAKDFILRMQNKCTYLHGENDYCLPKKSLLFSEYNCLQYLNKLRIDGCEISKDLKDKIYREVFLKIKKPTRKKISEFIKSNTGYENSELLSNIDEVTCDMSSYITFKEIFGTDFENNYNIIEEIIKDITIFKDKKILEKRLIEVYHLDSEKVAAIKNLNYEGYASLSKHFLGSLLKEDTKTGELYGPIIQIMRDTNLNLQQILLGKEYHFIEAVDKYNAEIMSNYENVDFRTFIDDNIFVSPMMKRSLIQTYKIIEEVEKILGQPIDSYYIECSRTNNAKKEIISSRYNQIKSLLDDCSQFICDTYRIDKLKGELEKNKNDLRSDKIYLYFTQLGKCMYTLEDIDLNTLVHENYIYDIDHIYPQSLIKDDSLNNRVLSKKDFNNRIKGDRFLFEIEGMKKEELEKFYKKLLLSKLIPKEKYRRLTQKEVSESEFEKFVNRQIVSTNQSVSGIVELLKNFKHVDATKIVYSKAENISDFRKKYDILKSRTANNYHHAHDAYLNVVIGRAIDEYYKNNLYKEINFYQIRNRDYTINPETILEKDRIVQTKLGKKIIWDKKKMLELIKKTIQTRFDIHETIRSYNPTEMYKKVTILPAGKGLIPIKTTTNQRLTSKYGGLSDNSYAKYVILEVLDKKGRLSYILEAIPFNNKNNVEEYVQRNLIDGKKYCSFKILVDNIKTNTVIELEKRKFCITGKTNNNYLIKNLNDRNFSYSAIKIIKAIEKYNNCEIYEIPMSIEDQKIIISGNSKSPSIEITIYDCEYLLDEIIKTFKKKIYSFSIIEDIISKLEKYDFTNFTVKKYIKLITELLKLLKTNERKTANLEIIDGVPTAGTLIINKKLTKNMKFICESVTGYYRKIIFEVPN